MSGIGRAGGSAEEVAARKRAQAEKLMREAAAFDSGAAGERYVAGVLDGLPRDFSVLHDLRIPGSRANVDHLVIGPTGTFVVDAKNHDCAFTFNKGVLWRGRTPFSKELDKAKWEAQRMREELHTPVGVVVCFTRARLPQPVMVIDEVLICEAAQLVNLILGATVSMTAEGAAAVTANARRLIIDDTTPAPAAPRSPAALRPTSAPAVRNRRRRSRHEKPRRSNRRRGARNLGAELLGLVLTGAALIGGAKWMASGVTKFAQSAAPTQEAPPVAIADSTTTTSPSSTTTSTDSAAVDTTSTPTTLLAAPPAPVVWWGCNTPGSGWSVVPVWPDDPAGARRYEFSWRSSDQTWIPWADVTGPDDVIVALDGFDAGASFEVQAVAVADDGMRSGPTEALAQAPPDAC